ncbi:outer membrane beta-barrel protein [Bradyrhizobium sp. G127]|jgi:opacity protein-like surface antigen|uniref:outer membrane protein n=1 Tax=Bradyrhizobium sp. G127 TaxID=2904800 RepID=UPI001F2C2D09|nr:outer membrane beta-barrel protein [Bradyrhizobium sp. G127]MCF2522287.1 outer membrane beta-barrel protein [Bradyrhizobium sp. G127]
MRRIVLAMMLAAVVQGAQAADFPDLPILRGSLREGLGARYARWDGFYVGGQAAYGSSDHNFNGATKDIAAQQLALTTVEQVLQVSTWPVIGGKVSHQNAAFGGFAGYNAQWSDTVLGVDVSYMHGTFGAKASGNMARQITVDDVNYSANATSAASINFTDVLTLRGRAGYAVGNFLPYAFGGVALGLADSNRSSIIRSTGTYVGTGTPTITDYDVTYSKAENKHGRLMVGYTFGVGAEAMLFGNFFARGEWEYVRFTGPIDTNVNTVRGGLGYRF